MIRSLSIIAVALAVLVGCPAVERQTTLTFDALDDPSALGYTVYLDGAEALQITSGSVHQFAATPGAYVLTAIRWDGVTFGLPDLLIIEPHSQHTVYVIPPAPRGDVQLIVIP